MCEEGDCAPTGVFKRREEIPHGNPDAVAWAECFATKFPDTDYDLMVGWFANAMMAMNDYLFHNEIKPMSDVLNKIKDSAWVSEEDGKYHCLYCDAEATECHFSECPVGMAFKVLDDLNKLEWKF